MSENNTRSTKSGIKTKGRGHRESGTGDNYDGRDGFFESIPQTKTTGPAKCFFIIFFKYFYK